MGFIRRLLGHRSGDATAPTTDPVSAAEMPDPDEVDASERAHEIDLLREEQARLDDLAQRQLKYARYSWQPPSQGGDRRADDADESP